MKTTVDISDSLFRDVRKFAKREGVTFRVLVERGLRRVIAEEKPKAPFKLRKASFKGTGLRPEYRHASWEELRDAAYGFAGREDDE